jgi:hypothetical protein
MEHLYYLSARNKKPYVLVAITCTHLFSLDYD